MKRVSIFLITVALIAGMVSCGGVEYVLAISSTEGGSVTIPSEGIFHYDEGEVVNLVATKDAGYRFDRWTGDVDDIADVEDATTIITMNDSYSITANLVGVEAGDVGIKSGDWIKLEYTVTGWCDGCPYPEWLKLEFLRVEGTIATVRATLHISDGTEQSDTVPVDVVTGGEALGFSGFVISANLTIGDSVHLTKLVDLTIEGKTARTYAGARRTVVYANLSQNEVQYTYYWDKLTGVIVEASTTYSDSTITAKIAETNMWEAITIQMPWWPWIIVAVAAVLVIFFVRRRGRGPADT